ncbi:MAG: methylated-DNA--[protein]-cysteine S-methyltransferase [Methanomicrobiales archaeon]
MSGSCRFGLWFVHVWWSGDQIFQVVFSKSPLIGAVPAAFILYCAAKAENFQSMESVATRYPTIYGRIYQEVRRVPYGETVTYGEIAGKVTTSPRVVGQAMRRNPTPLIIPCHRIVGKHSIGGFTPSSEIKESLILMEKKTMQKRNGIIDET